MAEIRNFGFVRHLRSEPTSYVMHFRRGRLVRSEAGAAFWFFPMSSAIVEVPVDDRELSLLFHGRAADYQDVTAQGVITYRVADPETLAARIDFGIDLRNGRHVDQPLERIALAVTQLAQQFAWTYIARSPVREVLEEGPERIRARVEDGLASDVARELARKLEKIEHLNVAPDLLGPVLTDLVRASTRHLASAEEA